MLFPESGPCADTVPGATLTLQSGVRFRAYPAPELARTLAQWIGCQRVIYNSKVAEDRLFAAQRRMDLRRYPSFPLPTPLDRCYSQFKDKTLTPWLFEVPSQVLRIASERWWDGKQRQLKKLAKAPTFRDKGNFDSVILSSELFRFVGIPDLGTGEIFRRLVIGTVAHPVGVLNFKAHCGYGEPKQLCIRRTGRHWWVSFSYEHAGPPEFVQRTDEELAYEVNLLSDAELSLASLGIDRNVKDNFIATSDGRFFKLSDIQLVRIARKEAALKRYRKQLARQKKGSANRAKTLKRMAAKNEYIAHVRQDFSHQTSHRLVRHAANDDRAPRLIGIEDLKVPNMVRKARTKQDPRTGKWLKNGRRAKSALTSRILAACWGRIKTQVCYKAHRRNCLVLAVAPHYSSQECSTCGHTHPDNRQGVRFICQRCHRIAHADTNAGETVKGRATDKVRAALVTNKRVRRVGWRKRQQTTRRESPGVPVQGGKTQDQGCANSIGGAQCPLKQEVSENASPDAPTTPRGG